jgi:carboxymethylenebutenolidase
MEAFVARPKTPRGAAIIVIQEAFGVDEHIQDVCQRFADEGYLAIAPQMFHRLGEDVRFGYDELSKLMSLFGKLKNEEFETDLRAAIAAARAEPGIDPKRVGVIGFCVGGFAAFLAACRTDANAVVSMYGSGVVRERPKITLRPLLSEAANISAPLLLLYGLKDQSIPQADVEAIRARLTELGKTFEIVVYPDAGHAFFNERRAQYHEPSAVDAWPKVTGWFERFLG